MSYDLTRVAHWVPDGAYLFQHIADRFLLQLTRLIGARSHIHQAPTGAIHWLEVNGTGPLPTAVLLHGLGSGSVHYARLLAKLKPRVRRIIAPDMPGHGMSAPLQPGASREDGWAAFCNALDEAIDEPAILFGNSLGGLGAIRYALERPQNVAGLMLVSPAGAFMRPAELERFLAGFEMPSHAHALDFTDRLFERPHRLRHLLAMGVRSRFSRPAVRQLLHGLTPEELLTPEQLSRLSMPIYLVWGQAERILPREHFRFFTDHLPAHTWREEPHNFGHAPFIDHPNRVARMLLRFAEHAAAAPA